VAASSDQGDSGDRDGGTRTPIWARPHHGKRRATLSREIIVRAALEIADTEGLAAVSIRRVAAALGARTMSLYTYIDSKDDLLDLMADEVAGEVLVDGELPGDWRAAITMIANRERDVALRHAWIVELVNTHGRGVVGPNSLRHLEQSMAALSGLEVSTNDAWRIIGAVDGYMLGCVTQEIREREVVGERGIALSDREALMQPYLQRLIDSGDFVNITPLLKNGIPSISANFERGLSWMLDGIERTYASRGRGAPVNGGAPRTSS
jgi:AcrR family transcriptional regulator